MKRILSLFLCLVLIASVAFQCSITSSAIAGLDDAVVLGLCLDLLSFGISIYSVQEFCKSDTFKDFCTSVGQHVDTGITAVKKSGKLFLATTKLAWQEICSWVKSKFNSTQHVYNIEFDSTVPSAPSSLTLSDGTTVSYASWMIHPFLIYRYNDVLHALVVDGDRPGVVCGASQIQLMCVGHGKASRYDYDGSSWVNAWTYDMNYGYPYRDGTGSYLIVGFGKDVGANNESFYLYRTIQRTLSSGTDAGYAPPQNVPEQETPAPAVVTMSSVPLYLPGSVDSPTQSIQDNELVLIPVPDNLIVEAGTANATLTTDMDAIGETIAEMTPADVNPRVLTNTDAAGSTVDEIIADTPVEEITPEGNDPVSDIETANKFRLPQSFLEGFPFSIPYSVYVGIQSFVASPEAPTFTIPFSIPRLGISENMEIDLSQFNPVARLCRALLSLVWVAGLAMACSKFIKR